VLLADPSWTSNATAQGWPKDRIAVATWPARVDAPPLPKDPLVTFIADITPLAPPQRLEDYSSHRLLWQQIAAELTADPFAAIDDPEGYLASRRRRAGIDDPAFDPRLFLHDLITPAVAQGLARVLLAAGVPLKLHGAGWAEIELLSGAATGAVTSRAALLSAVDSATLLIDPHPLGGPHSMHSMGRAVIRPRKQELHGFVDRVRRALTAPPAPAPVKNPLSLEEIRRFL
jgi:hypothetical protein